MHRSRTNKQFARIFVCQTALSCIPLLIVQHASAENDDDAMASGVASELYNFNVDVGFGGETIRLIWMWFCNSPHHINDADILTYMRW